MPSWSDYLPQILDLIIVLVVASYALHGYRHGWLVSVIGLAGVAMALFVALSFWAPLSRQIESRAGLPYGISKPTAFLGLWMVSDLVYGALIRVVLARQWRARRRTTVDRLLGAWPGAVHGVLIATVLLTIAASIPFQEPIASAFQLSRVSQALQPRGSVLAEQFTQIFGDAVQETVGLLTIRPDSTERVALQFRVMSPAIDSTAEVKMLDLVNRERTERGLRALQMDETLREVARQHSSDMFQRGYFAHVDPDGLNPFDRMRQGGGRFRAAGENLALAPTVEVAHNGLMNSPGHRANILSPSFGRVGIGVQDGGMHGKMFTQNFAD